MRLTPSFRAAMLAGASVVVVQASPAIAAESTISGSLTQFMGAAVSGDGSNGVRHGGRLDLFVAVPGSTIGLGDRLTINLHPEFVYGANTNSIGDGSILPVNTALVFPRNGGEDFDLSLNFTLRMGQRSSVTFGKVNLLDLVPKTPIVGGGGLEGFQNIVVAAPPSGLVPPSMLGALFTVPTERATFGLWIYDPSSQTNKTGFEHPFSKGVSTLMSVTIPVSIGGHPGYQNFKVAGTTKAGTDLADLPELLLPSGTGVAGKRRGGWNVGYSFQQYFSENPAVKGRGYGLFGQIALSDGNPTPLDWSGFVGVSGNPTSRPDDRFGVAIFRQSFSNVLVSAVAPKLTITDEQGLEAFYTAQLGKAFRLTGDLQVIDPASGGHATAVILGLRARASF